MNGHRWILFDADNTLWDVEQLYDQAREALCDLIATRGIEREKAEEFQRARDKELYSTYGYSACRFARSFEDTWMHFFPDSNPEDVRVARRIATDVFETRTVPAEGLDELLIDLAAAGFHLGIIAAGERWVQERRLNDFHLRHLFSVVEIVDAKTAQVFESFCQRNGIDKNNSWVVGDSIKSDVLPAMEAGLRAVWLRSRNWLEVEAVGSINSGIAAIDRLADLVEVPGVL